MWHEQAIIEWPRRAIYFTACCHSAKLCTHAARAFPIAIEASCDPRKKENDPGLKITALNQNLKLFEKVTYI